MNNPLLELSDKQFWHRFVAVYETHLAALTNVRRALEFGILKGNSIRWLAQKYPNAGIYGCDILPLQPEWPLSEAIHYFQLDQSSPDQLRQLFEHIGADLDLIIEDGSHKPLHQKNCLIEGIKHIRVDGIYILEDIHSSHPDHPYYKAAGTDAYIGPLHLLLAIEHLKAIKAELDESTLHKLSTNSIFTRDEVQLVYDKLADIVIFKRATLPHKCYSCGSSDFEYSRLRCVCGVNIYDAADSMTAILRVGP